MCASSSRTPRRPGSCVRMKPVTANTSTATSSCPCGYEAALLREKQRPDCRPAFSFDFKNACLLDHLARQHAVNGLLHAGKERVQRAAGQGAIAITVTDQSFIPALEDEAGRRIRDGVAGGFGGVQRKSPESEHAQERNSESHVPRERGSRVTRLAVRNNQIESC